MGFAAVPHQEFKRSHIALMRLPELVRKVTALEKRLAALEFLRQLITSPTVCFPVDMY